MPTILSSLNPATGEIKVRYQEPYVTEGLNAKLAVLVPRGTYRGFRLGTHGSADTITIQADPDTLDHSANYLTSGGRALTIRRIGGNFAVAFPAPDTYIVTIDAAYTVGVPTTGSIKAYPLAEWSDPQLAESIILGVVVVPGGVIPAANITHDRRTWAWKELAQDAQAWMPLHTDVGFETMGAVPVDLGVVDPPPNGWFSTFAGPGAGGRRIEDTGDPPGYAFVPSTQNTGAISFSLYQQTAAPVDEGQTIRVRLRIRCLMVQTAGTLQIVARFATAVGAFHSLQVFAIDMTVLDPSFRVIETSFRVPSGAAFLTRVALEATAVNYGAAADCLALKDFQAWLEPQGRQHQGAGSWPGAQAAQVSQLRLIDKDALGPTPTDLVLTGTSPDLLLLHSADGSISDRKISFGGLIQGLGSARAEADARITMPTTTTNPYLLISENEGADTGYKIYSATADKAMFWVQAARWTGTDWSGSAGAMRVRVVTGQGLIIERSPLTAGTGTWADADWKKTAEFPGEFYGTLNDTAMMYQRGMIASKNEAARPRQKFETIPYASSTTRTLITEIGNPTALHRRARIYATHFTSVTNYSYIELVIGAYWDPDTSLWVRDGATTDIVSTFVFEDNELYHGTNRVAGATFADSAWLYWSVSRTAACHAWGYVYTNPAYEYPALAGYGIAGGYNVGYFCSFPSANVIRVNFGTAIKVVASIGLGGAFGGSAAAVIANYYGATGIGVTPLTLTSTYCDFRLYNTSTLGLFNPKTTVLTFSFAVHSDIFN